MTTLLKCPSVDHRLQPSAMARRVTSPEAIRRLTIVAVIAGLMTIFLPLLGFSIDFGHIAAVRGELHRRVQDTALAAAQSLLVQHTPIVSVAEMPRSQVPPLRTLDRTGQIQLQLGCWDDSTREFQVTDGARANAVQAIGAERARPLYFSRIVGRDTYTASAVAVGIMRPREIILVVDCSEDSRLAVEAAVGQLAGRLNNSPTDDRVALVLLGQTREHSAILVPLSSDPSLVTRALAENARTGQQPRESLISGLRLARRHLQTVARPGTDQAIWVISDRGAATSRLNTLGRRRLENELSLIQESSVRVESISWSEPAGTPDPVFQLISNAARQHYQLARVTRADPSLLVEALYQLESQRRVGLIR